MVRLVSLSMFKTPSFVLLIDPRRFFFCESLFLLFMFHVCLYYTVFSVPCSLVNTCWERAALLRVMFSCIFVTSPYSVSVHVWYLIASIPDLCRLLYFCFNFYSLSLTCFRESSLFTFPLCRTSLSQRLLILYFHTLEKKVE